MLRPFTLSCVALLVAACGLIACGDDSRRRADTGVGDSSTADSSTADSSTTDTGTADSNTADSSTTDTNVGDSSTADSGAADSSTTDTGIGDSSTADSSTTDSGIGDSGAPDTGTGSGIPRDTPVTDLTPAQISHLCMYALMTAGGAGSVYSCPSGPVIVDSQSGCEDSASMPSASCMATVGDVEDCLALVGTDACSSSSSPACMALAACAT